MSYIDNSSVSSELSFALANGDIALWLGPQWSKLEVANCETVRSVDWLGIWIEARLRNAIGPLAVGSQTSSGRLVIDVPDQIEDVLGTHYSIADVCPHFYLNGYDEIDPLSTRQRRISRDLKVEQLSRLKTSVILVAGYHDSAELIECLEEVCEAAPDCRRIFVTQPPSNTTAEVNSKLAPRLGERIIIVQDRLDSLLKAIQSRRAALSPTRSIRVGTESVQLDRLLRSEPPLDQDFIIVSEQDVRDPDPEEAEEDLLVQLLSGQSPPWRAFAHQKDWQRSQSLRRDVLARLNDLRRGAPKVACLNIPAESGAGLTTLLQQVAFDTARSGAPTFFHRGNSEFEYDRLRAFLTDLHSSVDGRSTPQEPSVVVFDADSIRADSTGQLRTVPGKMMRDGRRVLFIRGIPVPSADLLTADFKKRYESLRQTEPLDESWMSVLKSSLDEVEQQSLLNWASKQFVSVGKVLPPTASRVIKSWGSETNHVPLLIFLYAILSGDLRESAGLGRHLVTEFGVALRQMGVKVPSSGVQSDEPLRGDQLHAAIQRLQASWRRLPDSKPPEPSDFAAVFVTLAALGCLRLKATRSIIADLTDIAPQSVLEVVRSLERWNLASSDLGGISSSAGGNSLAPAAFYTREDAIGLIHPTYGDLVFEWLLAQDAAPDRELLSSEGLLDRFLDAIRGQDAQDAIPIRLLEPLFRALKPVHSHVRFAEDVAMRYLRLQKGRHHEDLVRWQWRNVSKLVEAFSWLDEQVVQQSASLLHSRGITRYKSCRPAVALAEARQRYEAAEADFDRAIQLARDGGAERPVNIMSSLGLLYLGWLERERDHGSDELAVELDKKVEHTFRAAISETAEANPYAVYGLASYLVSRYRRAVLDRQREETSSAASDLAEAIELLQIEPEAYFEDEWNVLKGNAIQLLGDEDAGRIIQHLKNTGDELGYALEALRAMDGMIPEVPTEEKGEVEQIRAAAAVLRSAHDAEVVHKTHLADLLRYAVFSADPDRLREPAYRQRYELIRKLMGSRYLDMPNWLYDFAMLCFQVGQHGDGADAFSKLRKGKRFFEVSRDRSCWLTENPDSLKPAQVFLRVISVEGLEGKAWGRVEHPRRFRDPVPLSVRSFRSRNKAVQVGHTFPCHISLNPAGPFAEPVGIKDSKSV